MRLKNDNRQIRADRNYHQRQEQVVPSRQLGNQEYTRQRRVHDTAHHSRHPHQGKILFGQKSGGLKLIAEVGEYESGNTSQIKRRRKNTTAPATAIRCARSENLKQDYQHQVQQQQLAMTVEERVIHYRIPLYFACTVKQQFYRIITLTVKRREKEYQNTQHSAAHQQFLIRNFQFTEHTLHRIHGTGKIKRNQSAENTQHNHIGNTLQFKGLVKMKLKHGFRTRHDIRNGRRRHCRNQQWKQRGHGQVYHQHLQRKHKPRNRSFEDTRHSTSGATSHQ